MFPINILLIDDHALFSRSLSIALEGYPEIEQFFLAQSMENLEQLIADKQIDIVLMDINLGSMSNMDGLEAASRLLIANPALKIIILTGYDLPVYRHEAKKRGFCGFLNKNIDPGELLFSLNHVFQGGACFPPEPESLILEELTETEKKILILISSGQKRSVVAKELFMSERTLSNHLQHIFEKLNVSSAVEAVTKAIRLGYIPPLP